MNWFRRIPLTAVLALSGCATGPPPDRPKPTAAQPCPAWLAWPADDDHSNPEAISPGCVSAANLGAMLADPADLIRGRPLGPADGQRAAKAVEVYRAGQVKPFETSSASGGTASAAPVASGSP
jgi:pilus assembly protein CpaD